METCFYTELTGVGAGRGCWREKSITNQKTWAWLSSKQFGNANKLSNPLKHLRDFGTQCSLAPVWVQRSMVTEGIRRFKPELSTRRGVELSIVLVCCVVPYSLQDWGTARAAGCCSEQQIFASWPDACCGWPGFLIWEYDQGLKNGRKTRESEFLQS